MEFSLLCKERYSVRKFSDKAIDEGTLQKILEAARLAPTAVNKQPFRILVVRTKENLDKLRKCTKYMFNAPMALIVFFNEDENWVRPTDNMKFGIYDATIVGTHLLLAIHDMGLGTTWVGYFNPHILNQEFNVPNYLEPVAIFPMGYPAEDAKPAPQHSKRKSLNELVAYEVLG